MNEETPKTEAAADSAAAAPKTTAAAPAASAETDAPAKQDGGALDLGTTLAAGAFDAEEKDEAGAQKGGEDAANEGDEQKDKEKQEAEGAPEAYEDFSLPEGYELADDVVEVFKGTAKELDLSQKEAQSLIDKVVPVYQSALIRKVQETAQQWRERSEADPEIGGTNLKRTLAHVARIRNRFAVDESGRIDPDIQEFLSSPIGNHPCAVKLLARAGAAISEGGFPQGGAAADSYTSEDFYRDSAREER